MMPSMSHDLVVQSHMVTRLHTRIWTIMTLPDIWCDVRAAHAMGTSLVIGTSTRKQGLSTIVTSVQVL